MSIEDIKCFRDHFVRRYVLVFAPAAKTLNLVGTNKISYISTYAYSIISIDINHIHIQLSPIVRPSTIICVSFDCLAIKLLQPNFSHNFGTSYIFPNKEIILLTFLFSSIDSKRRSNDGKRK